MLKNLTKPEWKTNYWYELIYDDGCGDGFGFPCDENGNVLPMENPAAYDNLEQCRNHPEKFVRSGEVIRLQNRYREPVKGLCSCGQWVELVDEYYGACQCPKCGKWYNLFGQELVSPEYWEQDPEELW